MSKEKKLKRYLIDGENVNDVWVNLLDRMKEDDKIVIFYTKNSPHIDYDKVMSIMSMKPKQVKWIRCYDGTNALDFQLCSVLGNMLAKKPKAEYFIVSNDTGYDAAVSFWKKNGYKVSRLKATDCVPTKEKKEEEEEEWTTSRRRRSPRRARQDRRNRSGRKQRITFRNGEPMAKDSRNEEGAVPAAAPAEKEEILRTAEAVMAPENANAETELQEERRNSYRRRGNRRNRYGRRSENGANHEAAEDSLAVTGEAVSEESREIRETAAPKETRETVAVVEQAPKQAPIPVKDEEKTAPAESEAEAAAASADAEETDQAQETAGRRQNSRRSNNRRSNNRRGRRNETREDAEKTEAEASAEAVTAENTVSGEAAVAVGVTADSVHAESSDEKAEVKTEVNADVKPERKRPVIPGFVMITEEKEENWVRMRPEDLKETKPAAVEAETEAEAPAETAEVKAEDTEKAPVETAEAAEPAPVVEEAVAVEAEDTEKAPAESGEAKAEAAEEAPAETTEAEAEAAEGTPAETTEAEAEATEGASTETAEAETDAEVAEAAEIAPVVEKAVTVEAEDTEEAPAEIVEVKAEDTAEAPVKSAEAEAAEETPAEPAEAEAAEETLAETAEAAEVPAEAAEPAPVVEEAVTVEAENTQEAPAETVEVKTEDTAEAQAEAAASEIPVDFTALLAEKIMEKAPCDEEACLRVVNCVERIVGSVAVTNRTLFHNALVAVLGAEGGDVIYSLLKGMPELQQLMKNRRQRKKNDRIRNYLELVLELSEIPDGDAEALNRFYHSMQKEELQKIYEECQKTFGQEQGNSYYQVIKKNFHILQKL